jgi:RNA polymerase sigma-70 factor (sigma-E family)
VRKGAGDDEAFTAFVAGAQRDLGHLALLLTGDRHRAEELVQDTLARTYGVWRRIGQDNPTGYARRVLVNAHTDSWRRRGREDLVDQVQDTAGATGSSAPDLTDAVVHRAEIVAALRALTHRERAVLVLRYYADLSEADTAAELGVSVGTVKSTPSRALSKLRDAAATAPTREQTATGGHTRTGQTGGTR